SRVRRTPPSTWASRISASDATRGLLQSGPGCATTARVIIGLTGGIGSGKSVVGGMLAELGAYVIDTDKVGHRVYAPGSEGFGRIVETFGRDVVAADGTIDRKKLGAVIFADAEKRGALNAIVHPLIFGEIMREIGEQRRSGFEGPIVPEAPG